MQCGLLFSSNAHVRCNGTQQAVHRPDLKFYVDAQAGDYREWLLSMNVRIKKVAHRRVCRLTLLKLRPSPPADRGRRFDAMIACRQAGKSL